MDQEKASKLLKQKLETLERENIALKKSLYELSARYNSMLSHKLPPFQLGEILDTALDVGIQTLLETSDVDQASDSFTSNSNQREKSKDSKLFSLKTELKVLLLTEGHFGAVYAVQFSPCGRYLASGSFDKTVRVWDVAGQKEMHCLKKHMLNVSDVCWTADSTELLSGGYDQACKTWDFESGKLLESFETEGFVQCVQFNPADKNVFYCGTSRNVLCGYDRRDAKGGIIIRTSSMINSITVSPDGQKVYSGDASGMLKVWDVRTGISFNQGTCLHSFLNGNNDKPISHIAQYSDGADPEIRYLTVNSYDNGCLINRVMRVYEKDYSVSSIAFKVTHALKGYKNKNWPIRSSLFLNRDSNTHNLAHFTTWKNSSAEDIFPKTDVHDEIAEPGFERHKQEAMSLLATGSADPYIYVYSLGLNEVQMLTQGTSELVQRIEGHTDRVYAVHFHPKEPILASCSADFTLKVWTCTLRKRK